MYYVSYVEEYPIYEPAEGGYYYAGENVVQMRAVKTWRKARQLFNKWRKQLEQIAGTDRACHVAPGGCFRCGDGPEYRVSGKYIGDGCAVMLTRYEPKNRGYKPYN